MEKEMKKLLLVAVSVGVFLLVSVTVAMIVLTPKAQTQEAAFSSSVPYTHVRPIDNTLDQIDEIDGTVVVVNLEGERPEAVIGSDRNSGTRLTIQVPVPESAAIPDAAQTPAVTVKVQPPAAPAAAAKQTPPASQTPAAQTRSAAPTTPAASRTTASKTTAKTINDFWIQTGAYPSMVGAEDVREALANNGLVGIVSIFDDGRTWYRVRLGPYTSEKEARHWLAIVKSIDGFDKSEVRQTVR